MGRCPNTDTRDFIPLRECEFLHRQPQVTGLDCSLFCGISWKDQSVQLRQKIFVGLWLLATGVAMIGWVTGIGWAAALLVQHLIF